MQNQWLIAGHPFACAVVTKGMLLNGSDDMTVFSDSIKEETTENSNEAVFKEALEKVEAFLAGAVFYRERNELGLSVCCIRQTSKA